MSNLKFKSINTEYEVPVLDPANQSAYPRLTLKRDTTLVSVLAEYSQQAEQDTMTLKRGGKYYTIRKNSLKVNDWSLDFYVDTIETNISLDNIAGIKNIPAIPTADDYYGVNEDNENRHLEIRYIGIATAAEEEFAPNGVYVPNVLDSEETISARKNPDGYADYNDGARLITFHGGSPGRKHYRLVYHAQPFTIPE